MPNPKVNVESQNKGGKYKVKKLIIILLLATTIFAHPTQTTTQPVPQSTSEPTTQTQRCTVYSVSPDQTEVTISTPNGNLYTFYTDGCTDCKVGEEWEVTFNEDMEIISVD